MSARHGNPQPSQANGMEVAWKVQRLGVEEPTNKTPLAPRNSNGVEEIVQASGKLEDYLLRDLLGCDIASVLGVTFTPAHSLMAQAITGTALPLPAEHVSVLRSVGMPLRAMGFDSLPIPVVAHVGGSKVNVVRNSTKMVGTNAGPILADMVNFVAFGNWANFPLEYPAVSVNRAPASIGSATNAKDAVPIGIDEGGPNPTVFGLPHLRPEAFGDWNALLERTPSRHLATSITNCRKNVNNQITN